MISPQPIESNTAAPVSRAAPRPSSVGRPPPAGGRLLRRRRGWPRPRGPAAADDLDGDRLAGVVRVDGDDELLGAADPLAVDGDDDVLLVDPGLGGGAARLHVEHQGAVAGAVGDRAGVDAERGVHRRAGGDQLLGDVAHGVDRDGEAQADGAAWPCRRARRWRC